MEQNVQKQEAGRSMVEMLGVLAVIGVLSVAGVAGYKNAMNKHRANELLNEASKRATTVAAQISMRGQEASAAMIGEFTNPTGYTFGVTKKNENQFNITIGDSVANAICQQMKAAAGTNTQVRKINDGCTELTYNNDLSTTLYPSDFESKADCEGAGHSWCGSDSGVCATTGTDCCTVLNYDNGCQTCTGGAVKNDYNPVCQNCDGSYNDGVDCTTDGGKAGTCASGHCLPNDVQEDKACITQADCGGKNSGYFCYYSGYYKNKENIATAMGCTNPTDVSTCTTKGACKKVSSYFGADIKITGLGYLTKSTKMIWWSAVQWCEAQGRSLFDLSGNKLGCKNPNIGTGSNTGYCCDPNATTCNDNIANQSAAMQALRSGSLGSDALWTKNAYSSDRAFVVFLGSGNVTSNDRYYTSYLYFNYCALCQ